MWRIPLSLCCIYLSACGKLQRPVLQMWLNSIPEAEAINGGRYHLPVCCLSGKTAIFLLVLPHIGNCNIVNEGRGRSWREGQKRTKQMHFFFICYYCHLLSEQTRLSWVFKNSFRKEQKAQHRNGEWQTLRCHSCSLQVKFFITHSCLCLNNV